MAKNTYPMRTSPEFYNLIKEIQKQKFSKDGKLMTSSKITKGITKWKEIPKLKKALIDEWE